MTEKVRNSTDLLHFRLRNAAHVIFKFLFPSVCASCGHVGTLFCENCRCAVEGLTAPVYSQNGACERPLSSAWAAAKYSGPIPDIIQKFKYNGHFALAEPLAEVMIEAWLHMPTPPINLVIPIPLHHEREKKRGYNQSALLVEAFSRHFHLDSDMTALRRIKHTTPQVGLNATARQVNVQNAFWADAHRVAGKRILLVDDVFTTGATMFAAANALRCAGAADVTGFCVARAE